MNRIYNVKIKRIGHCFKEIPNNYLLWYLWHVMYVVKNLQAGVSCFKYDFN